jgi:hypothetical protein
LYSFSILRFYKRWTKHIFGYGFGTELKFIMSREGGGLPPEVTSHVNKLEGWVQRPLPEVNKLLPRSIQREVLT